MAEQPPFRIRMHAVGSPIYQALQELGMGLADHADKKGFDLTVPPKKYFIADTPEIPGLTGKMIDIRAQHNGENVARLYSDDSIAFDEKGAIVETWSVSIDQVGAQRPAPRQRGSHLSLVPKPGEK